MTLVEGESVLRRGGAVVGEESRKKAGREMMDEKPESIVRADMAGYSACATRTGNYSITENKQHNRFLCVLPC